MKTVTISQKEYENLIAEKERLSQQVDFLMEQMRLARHRQFGSSSEKSEYDASQLNLFNEAEACANEAATEPEIIEIQKRYRKKARQKKDRLPADLPIEVIEYTLSAEEQDCPECGNTLHVMGKEVREELKLIPAKAVIVRHIRYTYACRNCEKNNTVVPVIRAPIPKPVIKGSFASPEAVAHIITQKFVMATPLYRQEQEWNRQGIMLSRQTMSNWLIRCAEDWLEPVYDELHRRLLEHEVLHCDETTLQVLHEPGKTAQSKSYMWLYRTSGDAKKPIVLYEYQPSRSAVHPENFLMDWKGYLHADGYSGYHSLEKYGNITVIGCLAHARRKFNEALKTIPEKDRENSNAFIGKSYCNQLFDIERDIKTLSPKEKYTQRQKRAKPVLDEFFAWLNSENFSKGILGKAVGYTLGQWKYLERYLLDGRLEISNNRAERSIKPFVIGRKNFLFANTPRGAKASAIIYSMVETAKESGIDPYEYLTYIFKTAPQMDIQNNPDSVSLLLPEKFQEFAKG
ncbi:IS66 family transposase [Tyzzerella sp. OttesenSCG-928-J15]|nr:IS66 family transposase [Tyzzerella sp. OttesenSCG-928-J15]